MAKKIKQNNPIGTPFPDPPPEIEPLIIPEELKNQDVIPDENPFEIP